MRVPSFSVSGVDGTSSPASLATLSPYVLAGEGSTLEDEPVPMAMDEPAALKLALAGLPVAGVAGDILMKLN